MKQLRNVKIIWQILLANAQTQGVERAPAGVIKINPKILLCCVTVVMETSSGYLYLGHR